MSDAVRVYGGMKHRMNKGRRRRRGFGGSLFMIALLSGIVYALWTTRDSCAVATLIPGQRSYHVVAKDIFAKRARLAESQVWKALPPELGMGDVPARLSQDVGVPQWILNNLMPGACYVAGNDVKRFGDLLLLTRMTRVGVLLEKFRAFVPGLDTDFAGGLNLRRMGSMYYAVRGRALAVSLSRPGLVEALTLLPENALGEEALDAMTEALGDEDVYGRFRLEEDDPLGAAIESGTFSVRMDRATANVTCRTALRPAWRDQMAQLLDGVSPKTLQAPPDGMLTVSLNLGKPVHELWIAAGIAAGKQEAFDALWTKWAATPEGAAPGLSQSILGLLGPLGPGVRLSWIGVDLNEIVPAPELAATFDARADAVTAAFKALPPPPDGSQPWDMYLRYDEEAKLARLPLIGGPTLEPTAGMLGDALLVSSSRTIAERLLTEAAPPARLPKPGNLYACLKPYDCGKAVFDTASLLAEAQLLRGYTPETLREKYGPWLENAAKVQEVSALAVYDAGTIAVEVGMTCSPQAK